MTATPIMIDNPTINADTVKDVLRRHLSAGKISKVGHGLKTEEKVESEGKDRQKVIVNSASSEDVKKGDVILSVEYPLADLDPSEVRDAVDVLSFYAEKYRAEVHAATLAATVGEG